MKRLSLILITLLGITTLACSDDATPPLSGMSGSGGTGGTSAAGSGGSSAGSGGGGANAGGGGSGGSSAGNGGSTAGNTSGGASAGSGGTSGAAGSGGSGGSGGAAPATPSAGCDKPAGQDLGKWVEQPKISVNNKDRQWWVWLPEGYDPKRAYPVVYTFHGCGGPTNFIPMEKVAGKDAIIVRGTGATDGCWTYSGAGEDVKFFDATLAKVEADRCVDTSRVFSTGYSSGAWLTNTLACARGDKLRGAGTVSGGVVGDRGTCVGKFARLFIHDATDTTNKFVEAGNEKELGRIRDQNHCMTGDPAPESPEPCARYQGCDAGDPVILCKTTGKGHDRQDDLATTAFWNLFKSL